jgi:hypothetical protein
VEGREALWAFSSGNERMDGREKGTMAWTWEGGICSTVRFAEICSTYGGVRYSTSERDGGVRFELLLLLRAGCFEIDSLASMPPA